MFRNKPHSIEESPDRPLTLTWVMKQLSIPELRLWKSSVINRIRQWQHGTSEPDPREVQRLKLAEIGDRLRQSRQLQQFSLEAIAQNTQIPPRLLEAIESGNLAALPEPIYIRGMIKQFAEFLGMEGAAIAHELPIETATTAKITSTRSDVTFLQIRPIHLYLLYIALVILSVQGISNFLRQTAAETTWLDVTPLLTSKIAPSKPSPAKSVNNPPNLAADRVVVKLQLTDDSWLKVVVDGKPDFEGVLPKGSQRQWQARKELKIRAGNAGGVEVIVNQQDPQTLGEPGQMQEATYKPPAQS